MKHTAVVLASALLAALVAVGVAALEPERADILDRRFREVGVVGAHRGNFKGYDNATMWTVDFGRRR